VNFLKGGFISRHVPKGEAGGCTPTEILADQKAPLGSGGAPRRITTGSPRFLDFGTCLIRILFFKNRQLTLNKFVSIKLTHQEFYAPLQTLVCMFVTEEIQYHGGL
jgi:hypothetical protein